MRLKGVLLCCILATFASFGQVDTVMKDLTVDSAMILAIRNNENVRKTLLDFEISQKKIWESTAYGLPQVDFQGSFNQFIDIPTQVMDASALNPMAPEGELVELQFGQEFTSEGAFNVNQLIFDGSFIVGLQSAQRYEAFVNSTIEQSKRDVRIEVYKAYYGVLVAEEMKEIVDSIYIFSKQIEVETEALVEEGFMPVTQLDQARYSTLSALSQVKQAERQIALAYNLLRFQLGVSQTSEISLANTLVDFYYPGEEKDLVSTSFDPNLSLDVQMMMRNIELNEMNIKYERYQNLPGLYGFFQYKASAYRDQFNFFQNLPWYPTTIWGLQLNVPITSSGMRWAKTQQAILEVDKLNQDLSYMNRSLNLQYRQAVAVFLNAFELYQTEDENYDVARKIWINTKTKYDEGMVSSMELSQAQSQFFIANSRKMQALYDFLNAKAELEKLTNKFDN